MCWPNRMRVERFGYESSSVTVLQSVKEEKKKCRKKKQKCLEQEKQVDFCYWKSNYGFGLFVCLFSKITSWKKEGNWGDALKVERSGAVNELRKNYIAHISVYHYLIKCIKQCSVAGGNRSAADSSTAACFWCPEMCALLYLCCLPQLIKILCWEPEENAFQAWSFIQWPNNCTTGK